FALAAFFLAWAVVDEPQTVGGFIVLPIALAGGQLLTGFLLSRDQAVDTGSAPTSSAPSPPAADEMPAAAAEVGGGNGHVSDAHVDP
ncbi:MAG TPA: hypothetical protein VEM41_02905, partial [Actinomycetota bacterium]|nr:hypothetical protein [Actinomycetota bacterium]